MAEWEAKVAEREAKGVEGNQKGAKRERVGARPRQKGAKRVIGCERDAKGDSKVTKRRGTWNRFKKH